MALSKNPFARPAASKTKDALAKVRASASKRIAAVEDAAKRQLVKTRASAYSLATKAKEPIMGVAYNEGVRLAGHTGAFVADYLLPAARGAAGPGVMNALVRPATGLAVASFIGAAFTKGETRLHARVFGQGALHAAWAVVLRQVANMIAPGASDRAMGEAEGTGDVAGAVDY